MRKKKIYIKKGNKRKTFRVVCAIIYYDNWSPTGLGSTEILNVEINLYTDVWNHEITRKNILVKEVYLSESLYP